MTAFKRLGDRQMLLVDGFYLYRTGWSIHPIVNLHEHTSWQDAWLNLFVAQGALSEFVNHSVYKPKAGWQKANELLGLIGELVTEAEAKKNEAVISTIGSWNAYRIGNAVREFETVLQAEFGLTALFLVTPKRAYDVPMLVNAGASIFPDSMAQKVPEALLDATLGARCLAFELLTASAFHFHRVNEAVLRKYWGAVRPGKAHPGNRTIGDYLRALGKSRKGSPKVKAALRDIKDLYRNPVSHPDHVVKDIDEAIAVLNAIHTAVVSMLDAIPFPPP